MVTDAEIQEIIAAGEAGIGDALAAFGRAEASYMNSVQPRTYVVASASTGTLSR